MDLAWWEPLSPDEAAGVFEGLGASWWIAGGWSLDLHLGRPTRPHGDLDVCALLRDADAVRRHLAGWDLHVVRPPGSLSPWQRGGRNVWCRRTPDGPWAMQVLLEETDGDDWRYRRDQRIRRQARELGDRVLVPEVSLLYKSARPRPVDEADFTTVLPSLGEAARRWLADALSVATPGHPWIDRL